MATNELSPSEPRAQACRPRVLVVEDHASIREVLGMVLTGRGYDTAMVPHGAAALVMMDQWSPDVVLLTMDTPVMDGFAFLRALDSGGKRPDCILAIAPPGEHAQRAAVEKALGTVRAVLVKPFSIKDLLAAMDRYAPTAHTPAAAA